MKYTGTIQQVEELEEYVLTTQACYPRKKTGRDGDMWGTPKTAVMVTYEVYLTQEGRDLLADPDKWFGLIGCPSAKIRLHMFERDKSGEVRISPRDMPKLFSVYPVMAEMLSKMEYEDSFVPIKAHSRA